MKISKKFTTVTPFSKYLAMLLFILLPVGTFYVGLSVGSSSQQLSIPDSKPEAVTKKKFELVKEFGKVFFLDSEFGYKLDLSNLPKVEITDQDTDQSYVFEMYPKVNDSSIARFGISQLYSNNQNVSLAEIAKTKYDYVDGEGRYGAVNNSHLQSIKIAGKYEAVLWDSKLAIEGPTNERHYLISVDKKYLHLQLYTWSQQSFERAVTDLNKVLTTFDIITTWQN